MHIDRQRSGGLTRAYRFLVVSAVVSVTGSECRPDGSALFTEEAPQDRSDKRIFTRAAFGQDCLGTSASLEFLVEK